jgi:hypothetical protein
MMQLLTSWESDWKSFFSGMAAVESPMRVDASGGEDGASAVICSDMVSAYVQRLERHYRQLAYFSNKRQRRICAG